MIFAALLEVEPPLRGWLWSIGVPAALFVVSLLATWLLYRKFTDRRS
jgi:hypothetical protein